jgi:GNAT superfamily N-acetyltransferase
MNEDLNIRIAEKSDIPALIDFNQAMAFETEGKVLEDEVISGGVHAVFGDRGKGFYVVAEDTEGRIVGGLMITYEWSDWRNAWFWWIQSVYILPEARGKHIYLMLYEHVKGLARKRGDVFGFRLYVEKENSHAQKVYEKVGMEECHYLMYEEAI